MELTSALRNFAKHFGAAEVYQHARAIYLESPARESLPLVRSFCLAVSERCKKVTSYA